MKSGAAPFSEQERRTTAAESRAARQQTQLDRFLLDRATAHVDRWHSWPTLQRETDAEHHAITARIAYFVADLAKRNGVSVDPARVAVLALFHDEPEVLTGDVPRRMKDRSPEYAKAVKNLDALAAVDLADAAPLSVAETYLDVMMGWASGVEMEILKYADELAALAFVQDEIDAGNERMRDVWHGLSEAVHAYSWPWLIALREKEPDLP